MIVSDILGGLLGPLKDIIGEVVVDPNKKAQVNLALAQLEDQAQSRIDALVTAQTDINKVEAASGSVFVAGWRPAVGWVGALALLYSTLFQPLASWTAKVVFSYPGTFPVIDNQLLLYVLGGMLGIGTMRTVEKLNGVSTNTMTDVPGRINPVTAVDTKTTVKPSGEVTIDQATPKKHFHIF